MLRAPFRSALAASARVRRAGEERCEVPPAREDVRCVAAMRREFARSRRAFDFPARVARDDSRVGVGVRLLPWLEAARVFEVEVERLRVATPFARVAALARRGFSRVCWMLRLVMRPVRRALLLVELRDFDEEARPRADDRFDVDFAGIVFPSFRDEGNRELAIGVPEDVEALAFAGRLQ